MDELFRKLIDDTLTPEEFQTLRDYFNASSDEQLLTLIKSYISDMDGSSEVPGEILEAMKANIDRSLFPETVETKKSWKRRFYGVAAAVVLPLLILTAVTTYLFTKEEPLADTCTLITSGHETSALILSDGTSVKINGNSSLSFPSAFKKHSREVAFTGEAYFDVSKNPKAPFTILTPTMSVTVKGTSFNLMARAGARYSELSLDSGTVTVSPSGSDEEKTIKPGTKLILDNETMEMRTEPLSHPAASSSWASQELHFENASPEYVIDRLQQVYGITLDPQIRRSINENFTGTLPADDLDNALRILSKIYSN